MFFSILRPIISLTLSPLSLSTPQPSFDLTIHPSINQSISKLLKTLKPELSIFKLMDSSSRPEQHLPGPSQPDGSSNPPAGKSRSPVTTPPLSRYESQKRRDWNTFLQYLKNHKPPLTLSRCSGAHVIEFLKYLDQFGKTKVHVTACLYFGHPNPPAPCACPLRQAWGSLDALIGRLRAAFEENGGQPESNPFGARAVRIYLREVKDSQAKARGVPYEKKKRKRAGGGGSTSATVGTENAPVDDGGDGGGTSGINSSSEVDPVTSTV